MSTRGDGLSGVLVTGDLRTGKITKTEKGIDLALRTVNERVTEENSNLSAALEQKLTGYGFIEHDIFMGPPTEETQ